MKIEFGNCTAICIHKTLGYLRFIHRIVTMDKKVERAWASALTEKYLKGLGIIFSYICIVFALLFLATVCFMYFCFSWCFYWHRRITLEHFTFCFHFVFSICLSKNTIFLITQCFRSDMDLHRHVASWYEI